MTTIGMGGALALLLGAGMAVAPAHAADGGVTGPEVVAVFAQMDLEPELTTDSVGDPMVKFKINGLNAFANFYDCSDGTCGSLQLEVGLDMPDGLSLQMANVVNTRYRYVRVYLDDEMDPFIQYDFEVLHTDHVAHITSQVELYGSLLEKVAETIDF
jgi:hypothetical protein